MSSEPPTLGNNYVFLNVNFRIPVYVPCIAVSDYQAASGWSRFSNIQGEVEHTVTIGDSYHGHVDIVQNCTNNTATLTATPDRWFRFDHWSNGSTDNPYVISVTSDTTLTAFFEELCSERCEISIYATDIYGDGWNGNTIHIIQNGNEIDSYTMATQNMSYTLTYDTATIEVCSGTPIEFIWNRGSYPEETSFKIINAEGVQTYAIASGSALTNNEKFLSMDSCDGIRMICDTVFDTVYNNYTWYDSIYTESGIYTIDTLENGIHYFHTLVLTLTFQVTILSSNEDLGTVIGGGIYNQGETVTLTAIPNIGSRFDGWSNQCTTNPQQLTVTGNTTITAFFTAEFDTVIINYYQYDTTIVNVYDTVINNYYQYDTTIVNVFDTVIHNIYQCDTTIYNNYAYDTSIYNHFQYDTTMVFDTTIINVYTYDTSIYNNYQFDTVIINYYQYDTTTLIFDTVIVNTYQYDTTIVNVYDTVIQNSYQFDTVIVNHYLYDTTVVNIYDTTIMNYYQYDTTIVNNYTYNAPVYNSFVYDTTLVFDTMIVNIYTYDTSIYNNYQFDTVLLNYYQYDTTYVNTYDTTIINIYDTTISNLYQYDTVIVNYYQYDTMLVNVYDTTINNYYQYDTTVVNIEVTVYTYDTTVVNNQYYDTVFVTHYYHDTVVVNNYIYDTIYLNHYIFDTIYIHDTVFSDPTDPLGIPEVEMVDAKIYQRDGRIVVESGDGEPLGEVRVFDVMGRNVAAEDAAGRVSTDGANRTSFEVPASGAYIVKIGNRTARKIVVIR